MRDRYTVSPPLPVPEGSSEQLTHFIEWGVRAIEALVNLLGSGQHTVPDYVAQLQGDGQIVSIDTESSSVVMLNPNKAVQAFDEAKDQILNTEITIDTTLFDTSTELAAAFDDIQDYVADLRHTLTSAPPPVHDKPTPDNLTPRKYLPAGVERDLLSAVAKAVGRTRQRVVSALIGLEHQAQLINNSYPSASVRRSQPGGNRGLSTGSGGGYGPATQTGRSDEQGIDTRGQSSRARSGSEPVTSGQRAKAEEIYRYLTEKYGLTHNEAAAILGNMQVESGLNTAAYNRSEGAIGLIQWEGQRDDALRAFAGNRIGDWKTQVDFMMRELSTTESGAFAKFRRSAAISPEEGAAAFDQYYERSAGTSRSERRRFAKQFASSLSSGSVLSA